MLKRVPVILAAAAAAVLLAVPVASATNMTPLVTCVDKTDSGYVAHFGYRNDESFTVTRTIATAEGKYAWLNMIYDGTPGNWAQVVNATIGRGQPTTFKPGRYDDVFTVAFTGSNLTWALVGRFATASATSPICPEPETPQNTTPTPTTPAVTVPTVTTTSTTTTTPSVVPPAPRVCQSRRVLTIRLRERKGAKIRSARVVFNGKTVAVSRRTSDGRVVAKIDFRSLPSGRFTVTIRAKLTNGKTRTSTRKYYTCKPKLGPANNLGSTSSL